MSWLASASCLSFSYIFVAMMFVLAFVAIVLGFVYKINKS
jgi:hypothetical protein